MRKRVSPGVVLGLVAVVISMSGSAYAAVRITSSDIADGTIASKDIKNRAITPAKLSNSAMEALAGESGPAGPAGPAGPQGPAGAQGPAGPSAVGKLTPATVNFSVSGGSDPSATIKIVTAACPAGQRVVSGGYFMDAGIAFADKTYDGNGWSVGIDNYGSSVTADGNITALCSPAGMAVASSVNARSAAVASDVAKRRASHG